MIPIRLTKEMIEEFIEGVKSSIGKDDLADGILSFSYSFEEDAKNSQKTFPKVAFTKNAYFKMKRLVDGFSSEVGWHGTVERTGDEYLITDIIVYPQEVTSVTVTPDQAEYEEWIWSLPDEVFNGLRFHGHSHVDMPVNPSNVDMDFADNLVEQLSDGGFYIFMIVNKLGDIHCRVYDYDQNAMFDESEVEVVIPQEVNTDKFFAEAKKLVKEPKTRYVKGGNAYVSKNDKRTVSRDYEEPYDWYGFTSGIRK